MSEIDGGILIGTAATLALFHAVIGVDHSVPFVVLGRSRGWSLRKTLFITGLCGLGHVGSSVLIGGVGIVAGVAVQRLDWVETVRGEVAAWLLIGFGLGYAAWAFRRNFRGHRHAHSHTHSDGTVHLHSHDHSGEHLHPHRVGERSVTPWILFLVFAFGPCEALIPLMMASTVMGDWLGLFSVVVVFAAVTVGTMLAVVAVGYLGLGLRIREFRWLDRHADSLAGLTVAATGVAVMMFGI